MTASAIETTLRKSLIDLDLALPIAWENDNFKPVIDTPWMQVYHDPDAPVVATLSSIGEDEHRGGFNLTLYYPKGRGVAEVNAKADEIMAYYQAGARFAHDGQEVGVLSCGRSGGRTVDGWWSVTVTVDYWARTTRNVT